jgi:glycosyltransferase involved in cell wall biosynthesis
LQLPAAADHQFILYSPLQGRDAAQLGAPFRNGITAAFEHRGVPGSGGTWWEQTRLPAAASRDRLDVFFAPAYSAPLRLETPTVLTLHDVSFAAHPEWFSWREGLRRRWLARQAGLRARRIIAVSDFSRQEICRHLGLPRERISVVWSGVRARSARPDNAREPLVLYVGSIFNRRHIPELIQAFRLVADELPDARLAIVGDNRTHPYQNPEALAIAAGIQDRMAVLSYVSEDDLENLYARARVFVFLSEYEGFGMTPLEALSAGLSLVAADTPVARELYGSAAELVSPTDIAAVARALTRLLRDSAARAETRQRAAQLLPNFSWTRAARETLGVLEAAAVEQR